MANSGFGGYAVNIPSIFQSPGEALQQATVQKERDTQQLKQEGEKLQEMGMQQAKIAREEAAKKQLYMQEKLAPSQYATGVDMADDASRAELAKTYNDLKSISGNVSLPDLQDYIYKKVNNIASTTAQIKKEDEFFRQLLPELKKKYPGLNTDALYGSFKNEFGTRYVQNGEMNPNAKPSDILTNISNPSYLSDYITDPTGLNKILKDKFSAEKVPFKVGTPEANVTHLGNIGFWEDVNQPTPASGFYPKGTNLELVRKRGQGILTTPKGDVSVPTVTDDVYKNFLLQGGQNASAEIESLAKKKFNGANGQLDFSKMSETDKEVAKKHVLDEFIGAVDQKGLRTGETYNKPQTNIKVGGQQGIRDVYSDISNLVNSKKPGFATPVNELPATAQNIVLDYAKKLKGMDNLGNDEIVLNKMPNGEIGVYDFDQKTKTVGELIAPLEKTGVNIKAQPGAKGKNAVINQANNNQSSRTYNVNGTKMSHQDLLNKGYSEAQIQQAIKLGTIK